MLLSNTTTVGQELNIIQIAGGSWSVLAVLRGCFCIIWRIFRTHTVYSINAVSAISCNVAFNVPACQMTHTTEEPSHNRWQRLKLACPWFVHYDEQIMFLHVYWLFCQIVHQAFQDHSERIHCLMDFVGKKKNSWCEGKFSATNEIVTTVEPLNQFYVPAWCDQVVFYLLPLHFLSANLSDYLSFHLPQLFMISLSYNHEDAWKCN